MQLSSVRFLTTVNAILFGMLAVCVSPAVAQTTYYVDDNALNDPGPGDPTISDPAEDGSANHPFDAIREAINVTMDGDTVELLDGTYTGIENMDLDFGGRAITVRSASGDPELCIIDCMNGGGGFRFQSGEGADSVIEGLTIGHCRGPVKGGGVYCHSSSPTLTNCIITSCYGMEYGAGVYCKSSNPTLTKCKIAGNSASQGGGICCDASSPTLIDCTITGNWAGYGGGVYCSFDSGPTLIDCTISGNLGSGGGVYGLNSSPTLINCTITNNTAGSSSSGGAVRCDNSDPTLVNCVIAGNEATSNGGGIYCGGPRNPMLINCVVTRNSAVHGGGVYCYADNSLTLTNCILWGDMPEEVYTDSGGSPVIAYSNVQGSWSGIGNINADPLFFDADGPDNDLDTYDDNNYRLLSGSPCIDAGSNGAMPADVVDLDDDGNLTELLPFDRDGQPRFVDDPETTDTGLPMLPDYPEVVDMGPYEYRPEIIPGDMNGDRYVDLGDYESWLPCQAGPNQPLPTGCDGMDLDNDSDVDLNDFATFQTIFSEPSS